MGDRRLAGFTLTEVLISLVILCIVKAFAIPSYTSWQQRVQFNQQVTAFQRLLVAARTAAISQQTTVIVCPSADHQHCDTTRNWSQDIIARTMTPDFLAVFVHQSNVDIEWHSSLAQNAALIFTESGGTRGQQGHFQFRAGSFNKILTINRGGRLLT